MNAMALVRVTKRTRFTLLRYFPHLYYCLSDYYHRCCSSGPSGWFYTFSGW